jgi:hypothetical protein
VRTGINVAFLQGECFDAKSNDLVISKGGESNTEIKEYMKMKVEGRKLRRE